MKIILFFMFAINLIAQDNYSMRVAYGSATQNNLGDIIIGNLGSSPENLTVIALESGYMLKKDAFDSPIDIYLKVGLARFSEDRYENVYEIITYIKAYYNLNVLDTKLRFGFGEGFSVTTGTLRTERLEALQNSGTNSNFLNYLDLSLDVDIGKLVGYKPMHDLYFGILLKHRSGIFGLINGVTKGGSNYNSIYIEKNF